MKIKRRDFLKGAAGSIALLSLDSTPVKAKTVVALPPEALGILYDSTLCIGCNACMAACKDANNMEPEFTGDQQIWDNPQDLSANTLNVIKKFTDGTGEKKTGLKMAMLLLKDIAYTVLIPPVLRPARYLP